MKNSENLENLSKTYITDETITDINLKVLNAQKIKNDKNWNNRIHFHPYLMFYYTLSGKARFSIEDKVVGVEKDDFLIINSNIGHSLYPSEGEEQFSYISIGLDSISVLKSDDGINFNNHTSFFKESLKNYESGAKQLLNEIVKEYKSNDKYSKSMVNSLANVGLIFLLRFYDDRLVITHDKKINRQIDYIKNYIDNNYSKDIKLEDLAQIAYMNKFHLISEFKQSYRVTPIEYLILKRIEVTKNLLVSTNYSMEEISDIVGFNSQSYFNQVFKKKVGITPSKFRKNHRV